MKKNVNMYSKIVYDYANKDFSRVIIPDLILKKESVACGDYIAISGEVDDSILLLNCASINSCVLSRAMCNYINTNFNDKELSVIEMEVDALYNNIMENKHVLFELFQLNYYKMKHRFDCLFSPLKLLKNFIHQIKTIPEVTSKRVNTLENLECDACVGACRIDWKNVNSASLKNDSKKEYPKAFLDKWLPYAKVYLSNEEKKELANVCVDVSEYELQFLSDRTINTFILKNIYESAPQLIDRKWKPAAYLVQKNEVNSKYVDKIKEYIKNNGLKLYFVKGYITQQYYDNPSLRIHSDYDLIATNSKDAFTLTHHLIREGFRIRPHLFSYKNITVGENDTISGHFHMQKIIDDMYMLEIDISFPGFLLNRVNLFFPRYSNASISVEDQIIITLLHLYKHSNVFMKDINDLFYMLNRGNVDIEYLKFVLDKYNIKDYFNLAFMFIYNNYNINIDIMNSYICKLNLNKEILMEYPDWPYDESEHLRIKTKDYEDRIRTTNDTERCFLSPVAIFENEINIMNIKNSDLCCADNMIGDSIRVFNFEQYSLYLTSFGLFIDFSIDTELVGRRKLIKEIDKFLAKIGAKSIYSIPYATDSFYVRSI